MARQNTQTSNAKLPPLSFSITFPQSDEQPKVPQTVLPDKTSQWMPFIQDMFIDTPADSLAQDLLDKSLDKDKLHV